FAVRPRQKHGAKPLTLTIECRCVRHLHCSDHDSNSGCEHHHCLNHVSHCYCLRCWWSYWYALLVVTCSALRSCRNGNSSVFNFKWRCEQYCSGWSLTRNKREE